MKVTHWATGSRRRWTRARRRVEWWTACGRWLPLSRTTVPNEVTCKQCRRYLDKLG
jgi:hypothetical protein